MASYRERWAAYFDFLDANGDQKIDLQYEADYFVKKMNEHANMPEEQARKVGNDHLAFFKMLTADTRSQDGVITKPELLAAVEKHFVGKTKETAPDWWKSYTAESFAYFTQGKPVSIDEMVFGVQRLDPTATEANIRAALAWAIAQSPAGVYDISAFQAVIFDWAANEGPAVEASTLTPWLPKPRSA